MIKRPFKKKWLNSSLLILVLMCFHLNAQNDSEDFNTWTGLALDYELNKDWKIGIEGQLRMEDNVSEIDQYFGEIGVQYKLLADFKLAAGLRYVRNNDHRGSIQGYENHLRYNVDVSYKHKIERVGLKYRLRYQNKNELGISIDDGDLIKHGIRFKGTINYNFKNWKLDPKLSSEIFNRFEKNDPYNGFNKYRISVGTNYKLKNIGELNLSYLFEKEFDVLNPQMVHIISLKYGYIIKKSKK